MKSKVGFLILAGGKSERLFPLETPKALIQVNGKSLLQQTLERLPQGRIYILCQRKDAVLYRKHLRDIGNLGNRQIRFLMEPEARDTAAALGFALRKLKGEGLDSLVVLGADQMIMNKGSFRKTLRSAIFEANKFSDHLVLIGGTAPNGGDGSGRRSRYGWIVSKATGESSNVREFIEKPLFKNLSRFRRRAFVNMGVFAGKFSTFEDLYRQHGSPALRSSIDYAIVEKTKKLRVIRYHGEWDDLGTWDAVHRYRSSSQFRGYSLNSFVWNDLGLEVYIGNIHNIVLVACGNRLMLCRKNDAAKLKSLLHRWK